MLAQRRAAAALSLAAVALLVLSWLRRRRRAQLAENSPPATETPAQRAAAAAELRISTSQLHLPATPRSERRSLALSSPELGSRFGLDIGGSLAKLVFFEKDGFSDRVLEFVTASQTYGTSGVRDEALSVHLPALGGRLHFIRFATSHMKGAIDLLEEERLTAGVARIYATGGGAHKYREAFERRLGVRVTACNELGAVVLGICFMARSQVGECYTLESVADPHPKDGKPRRRSESGEEEEGLRKVPRAFSGAGGFFPFLLCNVGTGVSILRVEGESTYTRVSGTALGGGTFLGLARLLTRFHEFQQALDAAHDGDARHTDMLVRDIYGSGDERAGLKLPGDLTASFFAKSLLGGGGGSVDANGEPKSPGLGATAAASEADVCKALLVMISQNVAQIAHLAARVQGLRRVFFTGNFLRGNQMAVQTIVYTMRRWAELDGVETEAVFFRHEGYFGAIGAFLSTVEGATGPW